MNQTRLNPGATVSTDEMSLLALVNLRGPGELGETDLNNESTEARRRKGKV